MNRTTSVFVLSVFAAIVLLAASLADIMLDDGGRPYVATSLRGVQVEIYGGKGLYQFDSLYKAVLFRGFDWANLIINVPLFVWAIYLFRRGQLKGQLLVTAIFAYLAYNYLIGVMGNAFNGLFLVWTVLYSVGLFGVILTLREMDISSFPEKLGGHFPRRGLAIYVIILGLFLFVQYGVEILSAYGSGQPPGSLGMYTTLELAALELGIMVPLHIGGGILLWQRQAIGYLLTILLLFTALVTFIALSVAALMFYFFFKSGSVADVAIPVILATVATGFSIAVFRQVK